MDWNAIKNKASALGDKALAMGNRAVDAGLSALEKASAHTYEGLKKTPVAIKNGNELDEAKSAPLLVVIVVGKEDAASKSVLARMPVIFKDVWVYSASLKVILADDVPSELVSALGACEFPAVHVYRKGELEKNFQGLAALDFIKNIDLSRPKAEAMEVPEGKTDVIAETVSIPEAPVSESKRESVPAIPVPDGDSKSQPPVS